MRSTFEHNLAIIFFSIGIALSNYGQASCKVPTTGSEMNRDEFDALVDQLHIIGSAEIATLAEAFYSGDANLVAVHDVVGEKPRVFRRSGRANWSLIGEVETSQRFFGITENQASSAFNGRISFKFVGFSPGNRIALFRSIQSLGSGLYSTIEAEMNISNGEVKYFKERGLQPNPEGYSGFSISNFRSLMRARMERPSISISLPFAARMRKATIRLHFGEDATIGLADTLEAQIGHRTGDLESIRKLDQFMVDETVLTLLDRHGVQILGMRANQGDLSQDNSIQFYLKIEDSNFRSGYRYEARSYPMNRLFHDFDRNVHSR